MRGARRGVRYDHGYKITPERVQALHELRWGKCVKALGLARAVAKYGHLRPIEPKAGGCKHPRGVVCPDCFDNFPEGEREVAG